MLRPTTFTLLAFAITLCTSVALISQGTIEISGGLGLAAHVPVGSFVSPPSLPNPDVPLQYAPSSMAWRPQFFVGADLPFNSSWRFGASLLFNSVRMNYNASESTVIATPQGGTRVATLGHTLGINAASLGLRPYARWTIANNVVLEAGLPVMVPIVSSYQQTMQFTDPPNITFVDGSLQQITGSGVLPQVSSVVLGLDVRAEWLVPISDQVTLTPSMGIGTNLSSWQSAASLRTVQITPMVGVRYRPWTTQPVIMKDTTFIRDTVVILSNRVVSDSTERIQRIEEEFPGQERSKVVITEHYRTYVPKPPSVLRASMRLLFETEDGSLSTDARLRVSTVRRTRIVPVLPLVVFDDSSTMVPVRYVRLEKTNASTWSVEKALTSGTHWQYHVLNIAGARLRSIVNSKVQIITYDDGTPAGKTIAAERAKNVKEYLATTFGIAGNRLHVDVRNGQRSQQPWVFVIDSNRKVLAPIQATDTLTESLLPRVRIAPDVVSEAGVRSWSVDMSQTKSIHFIEGKGSVPTTLIWDMNESLKPEEAFVSPIRIQLTVTDADGTKVQSEPGVVTLAEVSTTDKAIRQQTRLEVLRWIGPDYLHTPDADIFGLSPTFDHIDVYPSSTRRSDFFVVDAPATVHPVGAPAWFREGLAPQEKPLFDHAEIYSKTGT